MRTCENCQRLFKALGRAAAECPHCGYKPTYEWFENRLHNDNVGDLLHTYPEVTMEIGKLSAKAKKSARKMFDIGEDEMVILS